MKPVLRSIVYLVAIALFAVATYPQNKLRKIDEVRYKYKNTPISVTYELAGQPFAGGNETLAHPEWIRELTLKITNISEKSIKTLSLQFIIEKQGTMEYRAAIPIRFPFAAEPLLDALGNPTGKYKKQIIKPGETVKISPPEGALMILDMLEHRNNITNISTIFLDIRGVSFEGGTRWDLGIDFIPDPNRPGRHIRRNESSLPFRR